MTQVKRFGVSMQADLLRDFDLYIKGKGYPTRSKAIEDIVRDELKKESLVSGRTGMGAVVLVYDHHKREVVARLTDIQHDYSSLVVCNQHVHLDHDNCMEIIVIRGSQKEMQKFTDKMKSQKGVKFASLTVAA